MLAYRIRAHDSPSMRILNPAGRFSTCVAVMLWVLMVFMIVPEGFDYGTLGTVSLPTSGSSLSRLIWFALLGGGAVIVWQAPLARLLLREINPFLLAFLLLAVASSAWSVEPLFTLRRLIRVGAIFLDAVALALVAWRPDRLQRLLRPILTTMLVGSLLFVATFPELGIERSSAAELVGAWHGLATQKNGLGSLAAIATLLWLHAWLSGEARRSAVLIGLSSALACLIFSRSSTSLMATLFAVCFMVLLLRSPPALRRYMPYLVGVFAVALLIYSLAILQFVPGLGFLLRPIMWLTAKDLTFSGRTAIWSIISDRIREHPLLGGGYGAYWTGADPGSASFEVMTRLNFYPTEAHNGYLDVLNDLGVFGGVCLLGYLIVFLSQSLRLLALERAQGALYLALLFEQLIANLSESRWFNVLCIEFVIMTLATVAMGRALLEQRLQFHFRRQAIVSGAARARSPGY